jgi:hypothetical protein
MADWKQTSSVKQKPLPPPSNILHEVEYRGRRIICTDDKNLIGPQYADKWGFAPDRGYVVLDEFDENVFPIGMHWFYTPDDAACAIEMLDTILPTIKAGQPATTLLYEYGVMRQYRREFFHIYGTLAKLQRIIDDAKVFDENPSTAIGRELHALRQVAAQSRKIG